MIVINPKIQLNDAEVNLTFIASPGPGGQNVNKVATAVQLRFDVLHSPTLPEYVRTRLLSLPKITTQGEIVIKASRHRTQERNKQDALQRLIDLIKFAAIIPKKRKKTKPTMASKERRLSQKKRHGQKKTLRNFRSE